MNQRQLRKDVVIMYEGPGEYAPDVSGKGHTYWRIATPRDTASLNVPSDANARRLVGDDGIVMQMGRN